MGDEVAVRPRIGSPPPSAVPAPLREQGVLSLEAVLVLPILALLIVALLEAAGLIRDVLLVHEAARAGARAAATSTGAESPLGAARAAAPELVVHVQVSPMVRGDGDVVTVTVTTDRRVGPVRHRIRAQAVARVEPAVGTTGQPGEPP
jgi:hypothetical protein